MKNISILLTLFCFVQFFGFAQYENSLLWEISKEGSTKKSYLYGTFDMICENSVNISPKFKSIITESEEIYLEINFNEDLDEFKRHFDGFLKNRKTLSSYYTTEEYK
jgi:uncharacterized protein YbaP (TraB family)